MSTPYTIIRCRMKDLISCFNACKLPIEKDGDESDHRKPQLSSIGADRNRERVRKVAVKGGGEESGACENEEDNYIEFYFKDDDGGRDVVEERGLESLPGRRRDNAICCNRRKQETYEESTGKIQLDTQHNNSEQHRYTLSESSDSSASSFAFPIIQREWTGSPVLMPRPEVHKSCGVCVQCCKF